MTKLHLFISIFATLVSISLNAQTIDNDALSEFPASTRRQVFEVCRHTKLDGQQQVSLAKAIEAENDKFVEITSANDGLLTTKGANQLRKQRETTLTKILNHDQLLQYWRGYYDEIANQEGTGIANKLQKKYGLTDQNHKFIRVAFYKIALDSRVIKKMMADQPKKAEKAIAELRKTQLESIEKKGGLRVNDDMTITWLREFNPNTLHK